MGLDKLKGWRTIIFNIATLIVMAGGYLTDTVKDPNTLIWVIVAVNIANLILRYMTTTPVGNPPPEIPPAP